MFGLRNKKNNILVRTLNKGLLYLIYLMLQLNYARYYLPKLFPDLKRIVFIDDDAIVQGKPPYFT